MTRSRLYLGWLLLLAVSPLWGAEPPTRQAAQRILEEEHHLRRLPSSSVWVTREERELRAAWREVASHHEATLLLQQALAEQIERNQRDFAAFRKVESTLQAALGTLKPEDKNRQPLEARLAALRKEVIAPEQLADQPAIRSRLLELVHHRHALWVAACAIRRQTPMVGETYARLAKNPQVARALSRLGENHRLGPARDYDQELKKLADYERDFLTDWVPLYLQAGRPRLAALANESTPVTFTWNSGSEPAVITAAMAEALGLRIAADGPTQQVTLAPQRTYRAREATIPSLRLGRARVENVKVLVLPPEGEDLGARIGPAALSGIGAVAQPERLRLWLASPDGEPQSLGR